MPIKRLTQSSLLDLEKYSSMLAGNEAYSPNAFVLLETTILSSNASSISFSSIDQSYKHLQLRMTTRNDPYSNLLLRLNSDSGGNYAYHDLSGNGGSVSASAGTGGQTSIVLTTTATTNQTSNVFSGVICDILDYTNTSKNTTVRTLGGVSDTSYNHIQLRSGVWLDTSAVTALSIGHNGNLVSGTRISLYGVKG